MREEDRIKDVANWCREIHIDGEVHDYEYGFRDALFFVLGNKMPERIIREIYIDDTDLVEKHLTGKYPWEKDEQ